jgi:hypothetical protein
MGKWWISRGKISYKWWIFCHHDHHDLSKTYSAVQFGLMGITWYNYGNNSQKLGKIPKCLVGPLVHVAKVRVWISGFLSWTIAIPNC